MMKRQRTLLDSFGGSFGGLQSTDSSTTNSSEPVNLQKRSKHKVLFVASWMTQYPWLVVVHDDDEPEKVLGLKCALCQWYSSHAPFILAAPRFQKILVNSLVLVGCS